MLSQIKCRTLRFMERCVAPSTFHEGCSNLLLFQFLCIPRSKLTFIGQVEPTHWSSTCPGHCALCGQSVVTSSKIILSEYLATHQKRLKDPFPVTISDNSDPFKIDHGKYSITVEVSLKWNEDLEEFTGTYKKMILLQNRFQEARNFGNKKKTYVYNIREIRRKISKRKIPTVKTAVQEYLKIYRQKECEMLSTFDKNNWHILK